MTGIRVQQKTHLSRFFKMAVMAGVEKAVRIHIERGDDVNARDDKGQTPLMLSAARNKPHICKFLLDAGADPWMLDAAGNDALGIAVAAGAREAALLIETTMAPAGTGTLEGCSGAPDLPANEGLSEAAQPEHMGSRSATEQASQGNIAQTLILAATEVYLSPQANGSVDRVTASVASGDPLLSSYTLSDYDEDGATLNLTGWESEDELTTPDGDPAVLSVAADIQNAISKHVPIDVSADWAEFEAFLPEYASPLPRADDAEARERLRALLLRAAREGSVPSKAIEDMTRNDVGLPNDHAESLLRMVINDLGAEIDERIEYSTPYESFEVHVEPRETPDEEVVVDSALAFINDLESRRNDPLRMYQRDFQHGSLLSADEEIALAKAMEQSIEEALDALASSVSGVTAVIEASTLVRLGQKTISWMSSGTRDEPQELNATQEEGVTASSDSVDEEDSKDSPDIPEEASNFMAKVEHLSSVANARTKGAGSVTAVRNALGVLGLSRNFLMELAESDRIREQAAAHSFSRAMCAFRSSRDRMAVANLKLAFSIAKKYMYSGMPLEDLLQEGNIGLIKGVDRYDWRRGFKFSTYATWWIRQQVGRFVADRSRTIRLPVHVHEKVQRIAQTVHVFEEKNGRTPSTREIAAIVELSEHKVAAYLRIAGEPLPIHELDVDELIARDCLDEFSARDPMEIVSDRQLISVVDRFLGTIRIKEERVLRMRYGIGIPEVMTLEEIGMRLDVTRERIRQIEAKAIRYLRHPARLEQLLRDINGPTPPPREKEDEDEKEEEDQPDCVNENQPGDPKAASSTKRSGKNDRKPSTATPSPPKGKLGDKGAPNQRVSGIPAVVQKILSEASEVGAEVLVNQDNGEQRIWIRFNPATQQPPHMLIGRLLAYGFRFWPGKGYCR